jgi:hypothetical protein
LEDQGYKLDDLREIPHSTAGSGGSVDRSIWNPLWKANRSEDETSWLQPKLE